MARKRTWGTPDPAIIVDYGDPHLNARVSDVVAQHGEIAVTYPASQGDARRLQRRVQRLAYEAGYRFNWVSTIVDDPDYLRGEARDRQS